MPKIKHIPLWFEWYVLNLPMYFYHEFCHWVFVVITWAFGLNTFPRIIVRRWAHWKEYEDNSELEQWTHSMYVHYRCSIPIITRICAFMPVIGTIVLFIISPWWLWILYLCQINTLWLSCGDYQQVMGRNINIKKD